MVRKAFVLILTGILLIGGIAYTKAATPSHPTHSPQNTQTTQRMKRRRRWMRWCRQNWKECQQRWLEILREREKCIETAKSFSEARTCLHQLRKKKHPGKGQERK